MLLLMFLVASALPQQLSDGELSGTTSNAETGSNGVVQVRFDVTEKGRLESCVVEGSSGNAELDAATCRIMLKRVRYQPARDAAGKPIRSSDTQRIRWKLEDPKAQAIAPADKQAAPQRR